MRTKDYDLDTATMQFREHPSQKTARIYWVVAKEYYDDEMLSRESLDFIAKETEPYFLLGGAS